MVGKHFLVKVASRLCRYPVGKKFRQIALSRTVIEINVFLHFAQKFKMSAKIEIGRLGRKF